MCGIRPHIIVVTLMFCIPLGIRARDSYRMVVSNHLALEVSSPIDSSSGSQSAVKNPYVSDLKRAVADEVDRLPQDTRVVPPPSVAHSGTGLTMILPMCGLFTMVGIAFFIVRRFDTITARSDLANQRLAALLKNNPSTEAFFKELTDVQHTSGDTDTRVFARAQSHKDESPDPLREFFAFVPGHLAALRKLFSDISRTPDETARREIIGEFLAQVGVLKNCCAALPLMHSAWVLAGTLEALLKQLSLRTCEIPPSALGTTAGAVDLLESLCVPGVEPTLAIDPPVRILAVDDDPVNHLAMALALKKILRPPDVADDGKAALALAANQDYDVIFLDVDMPGMDGFELCSWIHQMEQHRQTPVVFVTRYNNIHTRARAALSGGESLIAKPFMASEIAVKALTLALRKRLGNGAEESVQVSRIAGEPQATDDSKSSVALPSVV